jgi:hypothetical protein
MFIKKSNAQTTTFLIWPTLTCQRSVLTKKYRHSNLVGDPLGLNLISILLPCRIISQPEDQKKHVDVVRMRKEGEELSRNTEEKKSETGREGRGGEGGRKGGGGGLGLSQIMI